MKTAARPRRVHVRRGARADVAQDGEGDVVVRLDIDLLRERIKRPDALRALVRLLVKSVRDDP
jgi:hypothetical protein